MELDLVICLSIGGMNDCVKVLVCIFLVGWVWLASLSFDLAFYLWLDGSYILFLFCDVVMPLLDCLIFYFFTVLIVMVPLFLWLIIVSLRMNYHAKQLKTCYIAWDYIEPYTWALYMSIACPTIPKCQHENSELNINNKQKLNWVQSKINIPKLKIRYSVILFLRIFDLIFICLN